MSRYIPVAAKREVLRLYRWRASLDGATRIDVMYGVMETMAYLLAEGVAQTERVSKEDLDRYRAAHHYAVQMNGKPWARNWIDPGDVTAGCPPCSRDFNDRVCYRRRLQITEQGCVVTSDDPLMTVREVADELRLAESTLFSWRHATKHTGVQVGPVSFTLGGRVVYRRSAVDGWVAKQEQAG